MSSLFDTNKISLKKLFNVHQKEGLLKFTDLLKLCSTTRIFPDLLSSTELHRILIDVAKDPDTQTISQNLTYPQFESFLKQSSSICYQNKSEPDQEKLLFNHLKSSCNLRYSLDFDTSFTDKKPIKKIPKLNIEPSNYMKTGSKSSRRSFTNLNSARSLKNSSIIPRNSPQKTIEKPHKLHTSSIVTPSLIKQNSIPKTIIKPLLTQRNQKIVSKTSTSLASPCAKLNLEGKFEKLTQVFQRFKNRDLDAEVCKVRSRRFVKILQIVKRKVRLNLLMCKFSFGIWKVVSRIRRN